MSGWRAIKILSGLVIGAVFLGTCAPAELSKPADPFGTEYYLTNLAHCLIGGRG